MKSRIFASLFRCGLALGLCLSLGACASRAPDASMSLDLQALVQHPVRPLASLSVVVLRQGLPVYEGHFGQRVIADADHPQAMAADGATLYRMASVSKLFTALGVLRLVEAGQLDLDADVSNYLGFRLRNPHFAQQPITARMLLSHTSSLRDTGGYVFPLPTPLAQVLGPDAAPTTAARFWGAPDTRQTPGRYFQYCNLNYGVLGTLIEAISGVRFDLYMQAQVLRPLGLPGGFTPETLDTADVAHTAVLYRRGHDGDWKPAGPWIAQVDDYRGQVPAPRAGLAHYRIGSNATGFGPQGGLRTSVRALATVARLLLQGGSVDGVRLLQPETVRSMMTAAWTVDAQQSNGDTLHGLMRAWGLGLQRFTDTSAPGHGDRLRAAGGLRAVGHLGFAYGLHSGLLLDPAHGNAVVYAIGGTGDDPARHPGAYSSLPVWEEELVERLFAHAQ